MEEPPNSNANISKEVKEALKKIEPLLKEFNCKDVQDFINKNNEYLKFPLETVEDVEVIRRSYEGKKEMRELRYSSGVELIPLEYIKGVEHKEGMNYKLMYDSYTFIGLKSRYESYLEHGSDKRFLIQTELQQAEDFLQTANKDLGRREPHSFEYKQLVRGIKAREEYKDFLENEQKQIEQPDKTLRRETFKTSLSIEQIKKIHTGLIKEGFIDKDTNFEDFKIILTGNEENKFFNPVKWIDVNYKNGNFSLTFLKTLFETLLPPYFININTQKKANFSKLIRSCFHNNKGILIKAEQYKRADIIIEGSGAQRRDSRTITRLHILKQIIKEL